MPGRAPNAHPKRRWLQYGQPRHACNLCLSVFLSQEDMGTDSARRHRPVDPVTEAYEGGAADDELDAAEEDERPSISPGPQGVVRGSTRVTR